MEKKAKLFLLKNKENGDFNQYWYSDKTILFLARQAVKSESSCFLSTPSIYYAIDNPKHEKPIFLFDVRKGWFSTMLNLAQTIQIFTNTTSTIRSKFLKNTVTISISYLLTLLSSLLRFGRSTLRLSRRLSRKMRTAR